MTEYIKKEDVLRAYEEVQRRNGPWRFETLIESVPPADVAPVRHGRWIYAKTYYDADECNCSLCGQLMTTAINKRMNFCPNCGAKMDGVDDG